GNLTQGFQEFGPEILVLESQGLFHIPLRARLEAFQDSGSGNRGNDQDACFRKPCEDFHQGLFAVLLGHGDIQGDQVGAMLPIKRHGLVAVGTGGDDFVFPASLEEVLELPQQKIGIVHDDYRFFHVRSSFWPGLIMKSRKIRTPLAFNIPWMLQDSGSAFLSWKNRGGERCISPNGAWKDLRPRKLPAMTLAISPIMSMIIPISDSSGDNSLRSAWLNP